MVKEGKIRESNMELLRLIAMFLLMIGHALMFPFPDGQYISNNLVPYFFHFELKGLSIVCVDLFVLISGWYGIRFKFVKLFSIIFQTIFFSILIYMILLLLSPSKYLNFNSLSRILSLQSGDYWFVKAYVGLLLFAPFLNTCLDNAEERQIRYFLICFYIFQTIYGWLNLFGAQWFEGGFSLVSFMGLYVLARYTNLYVATNSINKFFYLFIYLFIGLGLGIIGFSLALLDIPIYGRLFTYTNPLVIIEALCLLLFVSRIRFFNSTINVIASSCLAIYLLHANELILRPIYFHQVNLWVEQYSLEKCLFLGGLWVLLWFLLALLIDVFRKYLWTKLVFFLELNS